MFRPSLPLFLASTSPRRQQLFKTFGLPFKILAPGISEGPPPFSDPKKTAIFWALKKAKAAGAKTKKGLVLGFDTVVFCNQKILGKPKSLKEARSMLALLSGRTHQVFTGAALVTLPGKKIKTGAELTQVTFRRLETKTINSYIRTGEPLDKAGGYGIQGRAGIFVRRISGNFFNVVGLPTNLLINLLAPHLRP